MVFQVIISVLDSGSGDIVFLGAPYSFYTVDSVPVNYTVGAVTAFDRKTEAIANVTYRIISDNDSCTFTRFYVDKLHLYYLLSKSRTQSRLHKNYTELCGTQIANNMHKLSTDSKRSIHV